jgi:hypothetical protein
MRSNLTHDFREDRELVLEHRSHTYLALVDLESYPAFARKSLDYLDMLEHLCRQMEALTATMWEVPDGTLRLKFVLTSDQAVGDRLYQTGHRVVAGGSVRSYGKLCLASHDRLFASARQRNRPLLHHRRSADARSPRLLLVPSGIYGVTVFSGTSASSRWMGEKDEIDYTIVLRHNPHPAPRLHPIRLPGLALGTARPVETPGPNATAHLIPLVNSIPSFCHLQA